MKLSIELPRLGHITFYPSDGSASVRLENMSIINIGEGWVEYEDERSYICILMGSMKIEF